MAPRSIDVIRQKTNCKRSTLFFVISKKTNLLMQHTFYLSLPLFCTTTMLSCSTKMSNFLVTTYFYGFVEELSCVLTRYFVSCVHVRFYFSLPLIFTLLAASISHFLTAAMNFSCFSSNEIHFLCFQSLALALSLLST